MYIVINIKCVFKNIFTIYNLHASNQQKNRKKNNKTNHFLIKQEGESTQL